MIKKKEAESALGVWCYQQWLKQIPFRLMFGWSVILSALLGLTSLLLVTHVNRTMGIDVHKFRQEEV